MNAQQSLFHYSNYFGWRLQFKCSQWALCVSIWFIKNLFNPIIKSWHILAFSFCNVSDHCKFLDFGQNKTFKGLCACKTMIILLITRLITHINMMAAKITTFNKKIPIISFAIMFFEPNYVCNGRFKSLILLIELLIYNLWNDLKKQLFHIHICSTASAGLIKSVW